MRYFEYPRSCEIIGVGRPPQRRYIWHLGRMTGELAAELSTESVELVAQGIEDLVGRATFRSQDVLSLPAPSATLRLGVVALELVGDDVRIKAWHAGAEVSGSAPPEPPALVVLLEAGCARGFAASCRAAATARDPRCPFCGEVLRASGHVCPRANGYRR